MIAMINARIIPFISLVLIVPSACRPVPVEKDLFTDIRMRYGIDVRHEIGEGFFPPDWTAPPISAKAESIKPPELRRFPALLAGALSKYPPAMIQRALKAIYLTGEMKFYGTIYGATSSWDTVYLNSRGEGEGYTDAYLTGSLHHEIAHILYRRHEFDARRWRSMNPRGFRYSGGEDGGMQAIRRGRDSLHGGPALYRRGFLSEYALSSLEEDFCTYSERIFTAPADFAGIMEKYPAVRKKFALWLDFYHSVDEGITRESVLRR